MTNVDPVVRSIRIASALNHRFGAILREAAVPQKVSEFELKIGEAQQIFPEIWRHLDEARAAMGQRGIVVQEYDALRATQGPGQLAVDNIEHSEGINPLALAFGRIQYSERKTASFNHEGHRKATEACSLLMRAMPEVDWRALADEEDREIAAIGSLSAAKWRPIVVACVLGLIALVVYSLAS